YRFSASSPGSGIHPRGCCGTAGASVEGDVAGRSRRVAGVRNGIHARRSSGSDPLPIGDSARCNSPGDSVKGTEGSTQGGQVSPRVPTGEAGPTPEEAARKAGDPGGPEVMSPIPLSFYGVYFWVRQTSDRLHLG